MTDIAAKAGVSRSAVSHVLNDRKYSNIRIPDSTRDRILEVASELGYRPNQLARSVASGKTRMIGYLVAEPDYEPFWSTVVGALIEAEELGFTLKVLSVTDATLADRVRQCVELRLSGLIVRTIGDKSLIFKEALHAEIPVVTVDEGFEENFGINVVPDDSIGCRDAIQHLIQLGHTRIGFISSGFPKLHNVSISRPDIGTARELLFQRIMHENNLGVPDGYITYDAMSVFGSFTETPAGRASVTKATTDLLSHPQGRPTAILCWRDETAMVAVRTCRQAGLRVPEDISIIGFSDISAARFFDPPLSTIKSPWEAMGRMAMYQVSEQIKKEFNPTPSSHSVATRFVARESTAPASE